MFLQSFLDSPIDEGTLAPLAEHLVCPEADPADLHLAVANLLQLTCDLSLRGGRRVGPPGPPL